MHTHSNDIIARPLTAKEFARFGQVIEKDGAENFTINNGMCRRYHDLAQIEIDGPEGRPLINIFSGSPYDLPLDLRMVERHPLGSQAFMPLSANPFLVIVCEDMNGTPMRPEAFLAGPGQGINIARNMWHGVLTPLFEPSNFLVVDRGGEGVNLEEYFFSEAFRVICEP